MERTGGPLAVVVAGANVHGCKLLAQTLDAVVVERPTPTPEQPQHLCLDRGYDNPTGHAAVAEHGYALPIRRVGEETLNPQGANTCPARRWVVERPLAWLSRGRAILVRYDERASSYLGLLKVACILIWFRRVHQVRLWG